MATIITVPHRTSNGGIFPNSFQTLAEHDSVLPKQFFRLVPSFFIFLYIKSFFKHVLSVVFIKQAKHWAYHYLKIILMNLDT